MERYRRLVESLPDGILIIEDELITFANPAAAALLGAETLVPLVGRSMFQSLDVASASPARERLTKWRAGQPAPPLEAKITRPDGTSREVSIAGAPLGALSADDHSAVLIVRDVTDQKSGERSLRQSEERLEMALAGAEVGVWDWDLESNAVVYSPRWKEMLGYSGDEIEPHVSAWERLVHPDDRSRADEANDSVARGVRSTYEAEFRLRHKDGHYVHVLSRGFPVRREAGGPVVRIVGTHFDLTERRRAEAERTRTEVLSRLVFVQEDERRRIGREMHDQFGEQLTALTLRIRMLKEAVGDNNGWRTHVESLAAIAERLDRDVDHLVWELRPTALDDLGLRAALANYVQNWSDRVGIPATVHTAGLLDHRLSPDAETALYRIAQEALTNVAKHAHAKNVGVILERRADHVLLVVEDDGIGFDVTAGEDRGHTFGLLGMHERAALVGATLEIESASGKGTTVLVRMAAVAADAPARDHV